MGAKTAGRGEAVTRHGTSRRASQPEHQNPILGKAKSSFLDPAPETSHCIPGKTPLLSAHTFNEAKYLTQAGRGLPDPWIRPLSPAGPCPERPAPAAGGVSREAQHFGLTGLRGGIGGGAGEFLALGQDLEMLWETEGALEKESLLS